MGSLQYMMSSPDKYNGENHEAAVEECAEDNPESFEDWEKGALD